MEEDRHNPRAIGQNVTSLWVSKNWKLLQESLQRSLLNMFRNVDIRHEYDDWVQNFIEFIIRRDYLARHLNPELSLQIPLWQLGTWCILRTLNVIRSQGKDMCTRWYNKSRTKYEASTLIHPRTKASPTPEDHVALQDQIDKVQKVVDDWSPEDKDLFWCTHRVS